MIRAVRVACGLVMAVLGVSSALAQTRTLPLRASALIAEPVSGRLYAALPARAGATGNSLVPIDPATATAGTPVFVGSDPDVLAATSDGQFIYVGLRGASAVRRFDVASNTAGPLYPLRRGGSQFDPEYARKLATVPAQPTTIVVGQSNEYSSSMRLVVYDDGVPRPVSPDVSFDDFVVIDPQTVVAASAFALVRLRLDGSGLTEEARLPGRWAGGALLGAAHPLVYARGGAFDVAAMREVRVMTPRPLYGGVTPPLVVPAQGRYYGVAGGALVAQALDTFDLLSSTPLDPQLGEPRALVSLGGGIAYITDRPRIVLVGDFGAPPPSPVPAPGPTARVDLTGCTACQGGEAFRATATFDNPGPVPVRVEVKARMTRQYGTEFDLSPFGGRHGEMDLPPGTQTITLLQGIVPPSFSLFGDWRIELALVEPASGRTFATTSQTFTIP
jgi:hypothetical protein